MAGPDSLMDSFKNDFVAEGGRAYFEQGTGRMIPLLVFRKKHGEYCLFVRYLKNILCEEHTL